MKNLKEWGPRMLVEAVTWNLEHGRPVQGLELKLAIRGFYEHPEHIIVVASCYIRYTREEIPSVFGGPPQLIRVLGDGYLGYINAPELLADCEEWLEPFVASTRPTRIPMRLGFPPTTQHVVFDYRMYWTGVTHGIRKRAKKI